MLLVCITFPVGWEFATVTITLQQLGSREGVMAIVCDDDDDDDNDDDDDDDDDDASNSIEWTTVPCIVETKRVADLDRLGTLA